MKWPWRERAVPYMIITTDKHETRHFLVQADEDVEPILDAILKDNVTQGFYEESEVPADVSARAEFLWRRRRYEYEGFDVTSFARVS